MPSPRHLLLAPLLALLAFAIVTAAFPVMWSNAHTALLFGRGGLKLNHKRTIYPGETATYEQSRPGNGWRRLDGKDYSFAYFLLPAFHNTQREIRLILPYWPPLLTLAIPFAILERRHRLRHRRAAEGRCPECGYPANGLNSPLCPECGKPHESTL